MSMFDRFKEQASRAANSKYSYSSWLPHFDWSNTTQAPLLLASKQVVRLATWQHLPVSKLYCEKGRAILFTHTTTAQSSPNFNSPIPGSLGEECQKASRILEQFISE